jgi:DNA-binding transcriptional regulator YiaG
MKDGVARTQKGTVSQTPRARARTLRDVFAGAPRALGIKDFCESYGVTQDTFTRLTGFSPRAVAHWASGDKPSTSTQRRLTELNRLFAALSELIDKDAIGPWLKQPNSAFDGSTPLQVIERGESDRIWRMVSELESGQPG